MKLIKNMTIRLVFIGIISCDIYGALNIQKGQIATKPSQPVQNNIGILKQFLSKKDGKRTEQDVANARRAFAALTSAERENPDNAKIIKKVNDILNPQKKIA